MCVCNAFGLWRQFALHEASCQLARVPRNTPICRIILHKPCNLAGKACSVTGCRLTSCAMQPRRQSLLGHGLSPHKLRHATSQAKPARSRAVASQAAPCNLAGKACSVTGCRLTSCAMQPRRQSLLGHGLSPYKKTISHCFLRERAPDEAA